MKVCITPTTNVLDTLEIMHNIIEDQKIKPSIRRKALQLIKNLPEGNQLAEIKKLFYFVRNKIRFVKDIYGIETLQYPMNTILMKGGDCDCKITLLGSLLTTIGNKIRFVIYKIKSPDDFDHINLQVFYNKGNKWLTLDPTRRSKPFGWTPKRFFDRKIIEFKKGGEIII